MSNEIPKRELSEVLENIVKLIPDEQEGFRTVLDSTRTSALYTPPEAMRDRWIDAMIHIKNYFGNRQPENWQPWERQVVEIFNPDFRFNQ